jgi:hypothetical protein
MAGKKDRIISYATAKRRGFEFYNTGRVRKGCGHKSKAFTRSKRCYQCWLEKTGAVEEHFEPKKTAKKKVTKEEESRDDMGVLNQYFG